MALRSAGFSDTAFRENRSKRFHSWVPWIGGFSATFVEEALAQFGANVEVVYDPFCGVGTTLVESAMSGRRSIGIELNPFASMAARVKSNAYYLNSTVLCGLVSSLCSAWDEVPDIREYPVAFGTREPFFSAENLRQVNKLLNWIDTLTSLTLESEFMRVAAGAILVSISNYAYGPSLATRTKSGMQVTELQDVLGMFLTKVRRMIADVEAVVADNPWSLAEVRVGSSLTHNELTQGVSADLIITSPPYLNNYHYVRNSRPQLFLLNLIETRKEMSKLQDENFGKYWQTVRDKPFPDIEVLCPTVKSLIETLKTQPHTSKKAYNGTGWAAYLATYFNDSKRSLQICHNVLKANGKALFVLGDSYLQGCYVPVQEIFGSVAEEVGFTVESCDRVRYRGGGSTVRSRKAVNATDHLPLSEFVVILSK